MFIINIDGEIGWDFDVKNLREQLIKAGGKDVIVNIASPGGLLSEGLKIRNELKNYAGIVDTHLTGIVASMGTYIALIGKRRTAEQNAIFMIHNVSMGAWGDYRVMSKAHNILNSMTGMISKEYVVKSKLDEAEIKTAMDDGTYYFGDEILDAGFIHEIIGEDSAENREDSIALAQLMVDECQAKVNAPEVIKKEVVALATMLQEVPTKKVIKSGKQKPDSQDNKNKNMEVKTMTLAELKEKFPELYNQLIAMGEEKGLATGLENGVTQERDRVKGLTEMRSKFKKPHSMNVIDIAIAEGHDLSTLSVNLMAADQANEELENSELDNTGTPANGGEGDAPEMKDGKMTHPDHVKSVQDQVAALPGIV